MPKSRAAWKAPAGYGCSVNKLHWLCEMVAAGSTARKTINEESSCQRLDYRNVSRAAAFLSDCADAATVSQQFLCSPFRNIFEVMKFRQRTYSLLQLTAVKVCIEVGIKKYAAPPAWCQLQNCLNLPGGSSHWRLLKQLGTTWRNGYLTVDVLMLIKV